MLRLPRTTGPASCFVVTSVYSCESSPCVSSESMYPRPAAAITTLESNLQLHAEKGSTIVHVGIRRIRIRYRRLVNMTKVRLEFHLVGLNRVVVDARGILPASFLLIRQSRNAAEPRGNLDL